MPATATRATPVVSSSSAASHPTSTPSRAPRSRVATVHMPVGFVLYTSRTTDSLSSSAAWNRNPYNPPLSPGDAAQIESRNLVGVSVTRHRRPERSLTSSSPIWGAGRRFGFVVLAGAHRIRTARSANAIAEPSISAPRRARHGTVPMRSQVYRLSWFLPEAGPLHLVASRPDRLRPPRVEVRRVLEMRADEVAVRHT